MFSLQRLAAATALAVAAAAPSAHAAPAADAATLEVGFSTFAGNLDYYGRNGSSSTCYEIVPSAPLVPCYVSFELRTNICNVDFGERAGTADYISPRPDFSIHDIPLHGAYAGGQGVLQSGPIIKIIGNTAYIFEMTIDAKKLCVEDVPVRRFQGKVTYL